MSADNRAEDQARAQYESIAAMLAAYEMDWDRYRELLELKNAADDEGESMAAEDLDELAELEDIALAADVTSYDEANDRISEDPLEVSVRSGWGSRYETLEPDDFRILLCTGGPAVQIMGELDHNGQPCRAWLEYQDWGTPWTQWHGADQDVLVRYASFFFV